jgi:hypothetical protein
MSATAKLQDMPPRGGYPKIPFARIPAKTYFKGDFFNDVSFRPILFVFVCLLQDGK